MPADRCRNQQSVDQSVDGCDIIVAFPGDGKDELSIVRDKRYRSRGSIALQIPLYSVNRKLKKKERKIKIQAWAEEEV